MGAQRWEKSLKRWYDRNPVDIVLVVALSLLLIYGGGFVSESFGLTIAGLMGGLLGWAILAVYIGDRVWKSVRGSDTTERTEADTQLTEDPLETLRSRYARGEIKEAEFERKLERLLETESVERTDERYDRELITEDT